MNIAVVMNDPKNPLDNANRDVLPYRNAQVETILRAPKYRPCVRASSRPLGRARPKRHHVGFSERTSRAST